MFDNPERRSIGNLNKLTEYYTAEYENIIATTPPEYVFQVTCEA